MIIFFDGLLVDWLIELESNLIEPVCGLVPGLFVDGFVLKGLAVLIYFLVDKMYIIHYTCTIIQLIDWLIDSLIANVVLEFHCNHFVKDLEKLIKLRKIYLPKVRNSYCKSRNQHWSP